MYRADGNNFIVLVARYGPIAFAYSAEIISGNLIRRCHDRTGEDDDMECLKGRLGVRKLYFVLQILGEAFLCVPKFISLAREYVLVDGTSVGHGDTTKTSKKDDERFASETQSLLYLQGPVATAGLRYQFRLFHDFAMAHGVPMGGILVCSRETCRRCDGRLQVDKNYHVVVFYHEYFGSYLGSRVTKCCRKCQIYEHYGFWTEKGNRYFKEDCCESSFLLTSEETVFSVSLLEECESLLVVGAVPFSTFASSYNRRFGYKQSVEMTDKSRAKRMKR